MLSSCSSWSVAVILKYAANNNNPAKTNIITKNTINPAHNLKNNKYIIATAKLHAKEPAIAHLVTYKSDSQVESLSTLTYDQLINLADESWEFPPFTVSNEIWFLYHLEQLFF